MKKIQNQKRCLSQAPELRASIKRGAGWGHLACLISEGNWPRPTMRRKKLKSCLGPKIRLLYHLDWPLYVGVYGQVPFLCPDFNVGRRDCRFFLVHRPAPIHIFNNSNGSGPPHIWPDPLGPTQYCVGLFLFRLIDTLIGLKQSAYFREGIISLRAHTLIYIQTFSNR
jgi:hypothetical protein